MTTLQWDRVGERYYEGGVDRGVLYLQDGRGVEWNGLISVSENFSGNEGSPVYFDGVKFANLMALGDFAATVKSYTYPDEFMQFEGFQEVANGMYVGNQRVERFGLSYRTKVGSDTDGDLGYVIHVLYNLTATPSQRAFDSIQADISPVQFEWNISSIPGEIPGFNATAHIMFDTRDMGPLVLKDIEDTLYGDGISQPTLPPLSTLVSFISDWVIIRITDHNDGTWSAEGPDSLISMINPTTFQIIQANATYIDANTYMVSNTTY